MALTDSIPFVFPGIPNVQCAFQKRTLSDDAPELCRENAKDAELAGGNISHDVEDSPINVQAARLSLMHTLGITRWAELKQVHGDRMIFDPAHVAEDKPATEEADGSATSKKGVALVIKTADCQPILLAHTSGKYIAALHAGWRGNHIGFPVSGVQSFCEKYGIQARDVMAVRGPSLGPAAAEFVNFSTEWGTQWEQWFNKNSRTMNLWELTRHQLQKTGIAKESIFGLDLCTYSLPQSFFSYRRGCKAQKVSGRQASLIWIKE